jgi:hypothetical protein
VWSGARRGRSRSWWWCCRRGGGGDAGHVTGDGVTVGLPVRGRAALGRGRRGDGAAGAALDPGLGHPAQVVVSASPVLRAGLGQQAERDGPQPLRGGRVSRPLLGAVRVGEEVSAVRHGTGFAAVVQIVVAGAASGRLRSNQ